MYGFAKVEDERVVKVLALFATLAMVGMAVMHSISVGELTYYYTQSGIFPNDPLALTIWSSVVGVNAALIGAAVGGPAGLAIGLAAGVALPW
ncbi:hypothetical protein AFULGI_00016820 [Archaeoglobus fulgidus DSM 8774]|uniref:Uncharacterized protein n=1 Tax=Archaeoglobus fulgidus DSM 8774 TaxID=1344584 RepID=A0A075WEL7_ARCFL|nr:hypothetical protein [Archaeoglobus fulgidus]AIG98441.1 hypothetical protein AFULGI_00016820 [Archaeoglobus fulgidus DSM 8774]